MAKPVLLVLMDYVIHPKLMSGVGNLGASPAGQMIIEDDIPDSFWTTLNNAAPIYEIQVFSHHSTMTGGVEAMANWFLGRKPSGLSILMEMGFPSVDPSGNLGSGSIIIGVNPDWTVTEGGLKPRI
jgi:hypothetical protein